MASRWIDVSLAQSEPIDLGVEAGAAGRLQFGVNILVYKTPSAVFDDEIESVLAAAGITGVYNSSKAVLPTTGACLSIHLTGGPPGLRTHNVTTEPAYRRSTAQLVARGPTKPAAKALAEAAMAALQAVKNQTIT